MKLNNFNKTLFTLCYICVVNSVGAANIVYEATDLTDIVAGEDLWKYTYSVSNHTFNIDNGFSIFFDSQLYSNLQDPTPMVNSDWDTLVFQPDNSLPDDGIYDALSLTNGASLADSFMLSFVWTGNGTPGAQAYDIYDETFNVVSSGVTQSSIVNVPEPTSIFLITFGLMGIVGVKKKNLLK